MNSGICALGAITSGVLHALFRTRVLGLLTLALAASVAARSQSLNGQIEGTVSDLNRSAVANVVVTARNVWTGTVRIFTTDDSGVYRFPLLPLGTYRITAEAPNFKTLIRQGVTLVAGETTTVDLLMPPGEIREVVTVSQEAGIADAGKTDLGRVMNTRDAQDLPLISRNPYNFGILQVNVTGRAARGFAPFIGINANGYLRRIRFQIDGSTNTQGDRGSVRFMSVSDTYVNEIRLVTNGFAAEFGNTPGMIMNVVTPSGTNRIRGTISYRFRLPSFYARPFFYPPTVDLPDNRSNDITLAIGGPIMRDRWHFYFGYEKLKRDDKALASRLLTIRPDDQLQLIAAGLPASIFPAAPPSYETGEYYIFRTDAQLNDKDRLAVRFNHADQQTKNVGAGLNTLERSTDVFSVDYGIAAQLTSYTPRHLNDLRIQYAWVRRPTGVGGSRNRFSGLGPSIVITNVANFGSPDVSDTVFPARRITQIQDDLSRTTGGHVLKIGGGVSFYDHAERSAVFARYTFPSIPAYIAARDGTDPRSYTSLVETFGDPQIRYRAAFWNYFLQDDWKVTPRLKLAFGLRYDLYRVPGADPVSALPASQRFHVDRNNFAPRLSIAYALHNGRRPTVARMGAGIYFDAPLLTMYQRALQNNGNQSFLTFTITPGVSYAPLFPGTLSSLPVGFGQPPQDIDTIAPDFENMYAIHTFFQVEQAVSDELSFTIGYVHSRGVHIPTYRSINCRPGSGTLADGRPFFGTRTVNSSGTITIRPCTNRILPQFQNILMVESAGVSRYDAITMQLTRRFSRGLQFSLNYTLSKAVDDAPEQNMTNGSTLQGLVVSDPTNRRLDRGDSFADQRHTFVLSMVFAPEFSSRRRWLGRLSNNNQIAAIITANSGETFNIVSGLDLNGDGIATSDRPVGINRNSGQSPPQYDADLRYSRFFRLGETRKLEVFGEFQNLFNINSIVQFNDITAPTNPVTGELIGSLPNFEARNRSVSQDSRQFQIGLRFIF